MGKFNNDKVKEIIANKEQYLTGDYIKKHKSLFIKCVLGIILITTLTFNVAFGNDSNNVASEGELENLDQVEIQQENEEELVEESQETIIVDIGGAVATPMVVELPSNARINDAIKAAGGITKNADLSNVNRAQVLEDGQKIFIPIKTNIKDSLKNEENKEMISNEQQYIGDNFKKEKINLNTATSEELRTLDGVGPATAEKIIRYRESEGSFKKIEDLKNVEGIGDKKFDSLKDYIAV